MINQGKIVEYIDQSRIQCCLCLQDKGNRLHLLTPLNRQINLAIKRALLISETSMNRDNPREDILNNLKLVEEKREKLKEEVKVKEIWELIQDEKESYDFKYLAQLCFGEEVTDDHISALVRALFEDKLYFKLKDGAFLPNSPERIEQITLKMEDEKRREDSLRQSSSWLLSMLQAGERVSDKSSAPEGVIRKLIDLAVYDKDAEDFLFGRELLQWIGITDTHKVKDVLIGLGIWEEDEPIDLIRYGIRNEFTEEQLNESEYLTGIEVDFQGREDLRHLPCFTIDGPYTKDYDDALSISMNGDFIEVGIHIADVASIIKRENLLDQEAFQRGSSLYLPRRHIPMIPPHLSQDMLSLRKDYDRPAISLMARFDSMGNLYDYRFCLSIINIREQFTYKEVNENYINEERFIRLGGLCDMLRNKRIEQGALILSLPEISINVSEDNTVSVNLVSQETASRKIVAESMILYNWLSARFCRDNNIPILYRSQKSPSEMLTIDDGGYIYYVFRQRRKLFPLVLDTQPLPHTGLGLDVYSNATSPIRRYLDLVMQRQMRNFLLNMPLDYNMEELEKIRITIANVLKDLNTIKRNRTSYWILKYLGLNQKKTYPAIILDVMKGKYRVILEDFLYTAEMKREDDHDFKAGEKIDIRVKKSDPWNDTLILEYAGK